MNVFHYLGVTILDIERKCSAMKMVLLSLVLMVFLLGPAHAGEKKLPTLKSLSTPT